MSTEEEYDYTDALEMAASDLASAFRDLRRAAKYLPQNNNRQRYRYNQMQQVLVHLEEAIGPSQEDACERSSSISVNSVLHGIARDEEGY